MKTDYTLLAARMEEGWVLINTRLHAPVAKRAIERGVLGFTPETLRSEVTYGHSRFDYLADDTYVELKGCSLVLENRCLFPNAPTARGVKHLESLIHAARSGYGAVILIMAVRPCDCFAPHPDRDPAFRKIFAKAIANGVGYRGFHIRIEAGRILYDGPLPLCP
ncbi:DNA/RNA nuclease SfsA [Hydrogenimonas sp. SS33]|uniref:DNA/RNA nuclease SfsA n=1 Tax=Hydrogenimonas leucolamina TaxID=2954236 RepID=UPI00336C1259